MKRKKRFSRFSVTAKYLFVILTILCAVLLVLSFRYEKQAGSARNAVSDFFSPVAEGYHAVTGFFQNKMKYFQDMDTLISKNAELENQVTALDSENQQLAADKSELTKLRDLYKLDQTYGSYPKTAAHVVYKQTGNWYNVFVIDKGTNDGISVGMNVLAGNGLVGIVTDAGKSYSVVRSIIDDKSSVSGVFSGTDETCIISGSLTLKEQSVCQMDVSLIDKDAKISQGQEIVTSQISDKFLPGLLIGYLSDYSVDSTNLTMTGHVTPAVDFSKLDMVLVITQLKNSDELKTYMDKADGS